MKNKKKALILISIALLLSLITAVSYAYWTVTKNQTTTNKIETGCFDLEIQNEQNAINLQKAFPISDEAGEALTPFTFTVKNTCNVNASYSLNLEMISGTTLSSDYMAIKLDNQAKMKLSGLTSVSTVLAGSTEARRITEGILGPGESETFSIRLWMDKDTPLSSETQNKTLKAKVVVESSAIDNDEKYSIAGYFVNEEEQPVSNAYLAVFSDKLHVVKTDLYGYFYVNGLERGIHEIYYLNNIDPTEMSKEEIQNSAVGNVETATNVKTDITFTNDYKITQVNVVDTKENPVAKYNINLNADNGEAITTKEVTQNKLYGELPTPTKSGYNFNGWYLNDKIINSEIIVTENSSHELKAKWDPKSYTATFNANGGSLASEDDLTKTIVYNTEYGTLPAVTRDGYTFTGWYTDSNSLVTDATVYTTADNIQLYAHWTPINYSISYALSGGSATNPTEYNIETETFTLNNPEKNNCDFLGWTGSNGSSTSTSVSIPKGSTGDKSYTANWYCPWIPTYFAYGQPTTSSTTDYSSVGKSVFAGLDTAGNYGACIIKSEKLICFRSNDYESERTHMINVFGRSSCNGDGSSGSISCNSGGFLCFVNNQQAECTLNGTRQKVAVYSWGYVVPIY